MKLKWQWFVGGRVMFWISIFLFIIFIGGFILTYIIDPVTCLGMKIQDIDETSIKEISERYVKILGIKVDKPIVYRFVNYNNNKSKKNQILFGTFHEWRNTYYIDISVDLYKMSKLNSVVIHETRHMLVEYLKDEKIIDLVKYSEEIAQEKEECYNNLFNEGIYLLKNLKS